MICLVNALRAPLIVSLIILCGINWYFKIYLESYLKIMKNFYKTDTSIRQTLWLVPRGVHLKRFYCISTLFSTSDFDIGSMRSDFVRYSLKSSKKELYSFTGSAANLAKVSKIRGKYRKFG